MDMVTRQHEIAHAQAKVGFCPFCQMNSAELWYDPAREDMITMFQVRCSTCGARGPWADCGWESAVPAWDQVRRVTGDDITWRGPGSDAVDPQAPKHA